MKLFLKDQEFHVPTSGIPTQVLHQKDEPPKCKTNGDYSQENRRTIGNKQPALKELTPANSLAPGPSTKAAVRKTPTSHVKEIYLPILKQALERKKTNGTVSGYGSAGKHHSWISFYLVNASNERCHFGNLPPTCWYMWICAPHTHIHPTASHPGTQHTQCHSLAESKPPADMCNLHKECPLRLGSGVQRGLPFWARCITFYTRSLLQDWEK